MKYYLLIVSCVILKTFFKTEACPDPLTTINIQNYDGPIYVGSDPKNGYECPCNNDQQLHHVKNCNNSYQGVITTEADNSKEPGYITIEIISPTGATTPAGFTTTEMSSPTENDCCCVCRHLSSCVPINSAAQSGSVCGTSYNNPSTTCHNNFGTGYNTGDTCCNRPEATRYNSNGYRNYGTGYSNYGTCQSSGESCYTNHKTTGYESPGTSYNVPHYQDGVCCPSRDSTVLAYGVLKKDYGCECGYQNCVY